MKKRITALVGAGLLAASATAFGAEVSGNAALATGYNVGVLHYEYPNDAGPNDISFAGSDVRDARVVFGLSKSL